MVPVISEGHRVDCFQVATAGSLLGVFAAANMTGKIARGLIYLGAALASCSHVIWQVLHGHNPL